MLIDLTYDLVLEIHFAVTGRYPTALMHEISKNKLEIYESLSRDLRRPDMMSGSQDFEVEGRKFTVLFASDTRQNDPLDDIRPLRVLHIDEHTRSGKTG